MLSIIRKRRFLNTAGLLVVAAEVFAAAEEGEMDRSTGSGHHKWHKNQALRLRERTATRSDGNHDPSQALWRGEADTCADVSGASVGRRLSADNGDWPSVAAAAALLVDRQHRSSNAHDRNDGRC